MVLIRIVSPYFEGIGKVMRIYEIIPPDILACPNIWSKFMPDEWDNLVESAGGVEADLITILEVTEVQDMR